MNVLQIFILSYNSIKLNLYQKNKYDQEKHYLSHKKK